MNQLQRLKKANNKYKWIFVVVTVEVILLKVFYKTFKCPSLYLYNTFLSEN